MMTPMSTYLSRLEMALCHSFPAAEREPPPPLAHEVLSTSPAKRLRSNSSEFGFPIESSVSSSSYSSYAASTSSSVPPSPLFSPSLVTSPSSLHPAHGLPLRSILSPSSSPPSSRPLSRRSSTGSKNVRFARCTNASVFPALSVDEYDRSPIVPTCESESLNLPARCAATDGWVKCVQRARTAEKERKANAAAQGKAVPTSVEGVHGLVGGGYFVGDENDKSQDFDQEDLEDVSGDDGMVVDDEEEGDSNSGDAPPQLTSDDSSGEDSDGVQSIASEHASTPLASSMPTLPVVAVAITEVDEEAIAAREEKARKCDRYGMCALGKYTRAELFRNHDSFGGF